MQFKVLMKKGNKQVARNLDVPVDSQIASATIAKKTMAREEQEDIKRLVLQYEEREETDQGLESPDGGSYLKKKIRFKYLDFPTNTRPQRGRGRGGNANNNNFVGIPSSGGRGGGSRINIIEKRGRRKY